MNTTRSIKFVQAEVVFIELPPSQTFLRCQRKSVFKAIVTIVIFTKRRILTFPNIGRKNWTRFVKQCSFLSAPFFLKFCLMPNSIHQIGVFLWVSTIPRYLMLLALKYVWNEMTISKNLGVSEPSCVCEPCQSFGMPLKRSWTGLHNRGFGGIRVNNVLLA